MARVLIPLAQGFEEIEAVTVIDVLRRGSVTVVTAALDASLTVHGAHGMDIAADTSMAAVEGELFDAVILPGGSEGTERLKGSTAVTECLRRHHAEGRLLAAICAAPTVLVAAEVVDEDVQLTCYPTCQMELDRDWTPVSVVDSGSVITGQAPGSAMLFALVVMKALVGDAVTARVARGLVTDVLN